MKKENKYTRALAIAKAVYPSSSDEVRVFLHDMFPGELQDGMPEKLPIDLILKEEIKSLKTELGKWKAYVEEQNNELKKLKEKLSAFDKIKKENESLRKDYRKSDWYLDFQTRLKTMGLKNRELTNAIGRLNRQLIQIRNDVQVYKATTE